MMNSLQLVPSTPAMAVATRSASYLGLFAGTGMGTDTFGRGQYVTTAAMCDHAKSFIRTWFANPAAKKDHSQWERPT